MAASRPPLLLNNFLNAVKSCKPTTYRSIRTPPASRSKLHTTARREQTTYPNRYGPAATESLPPPPKPAGSLAPKMEDVKQSDAPQQNKSQSQQTHQQQQQDARQTREAGDKPLQTDQKIDTEKKIEHTTPLEQAAAVVQAQKTASEEKQQPLPPELDVNQPLGTKELDIVLSQAKSSEDPSNRPRHPHMEPSPYEHHFDTYSLVRDLANETDTFTEQQSITIMKAIRLMLSINLELAKEGLISKSDIENESYLFRAACSELRTTLLTTRTAENQRLRTQRASLQHEMDILNQKVTQDVQTMREELKGMFNDRKMGLQEEKRKVDSQISELNYEITVLLNSEAKSEVEGLRWVLTRRAALAIGTAAFMTLSALQYYSVKSRENAEIEKKRAAVQKAQEEKIASETQAKYTTPSRSSGTQTEMREYEESLG